MKEIKKTIILILLISILSGIVNYIAISKINKKYQNKENEIIANILGEIIEKYPNINDDEIIKILNGSNNIKNGKEILSKYGINVNNSHAIAKLQNQKYEIIIINIIGILSLIVIIFVIIIMYENRRKKKIQTIIDYINQISQKNYSLKIEENTEGELSDLTNELYKITVMLKEQAENSYKDKEILQQSLENISHQLKTPLTSISIMLDNIRENPQMDECTKQGFIREICRQIEWINWLVISLLKLSKLDSNIAVFNVKKIKVKELIDNVIQNLSIPLDIKQQNIIIKDNEKDVSFMGDYNWQLEAITNIVKNCIEHTPENKNIYIDYEQNNFYTKIIIKDEGDGIDLKDLKHIFERFYKGKNSSNNSVGIGLALAKSIVEKDNGYIICYSELGKGTTFEIKYMVTR